MILAEGDFFQPRGSFGHDLLAGHRAASERNHVDFPVANQRGAGNGAATIDEIDDTVRYRGLVNQFDRASQRQRGVLAGFQYTGVAECDAAGDFHRAECQRRVPRADERCNAGAVLWFKLPDARFQRSPPTET